MKKIALLILLAVCVMGLPACGSESEAPVQTSTMVDESITMPDDIEQNKVYVCQTGEEKEYIILNMDFTGYWIMESCEPIAWDMENITLYPGSPDQQVFPYVCGAGKLTTNGKTFSVTDSIPSEIQNLIG